jgi:hypothetical protein
MPKPNLKPRRKLDATLRIRVPLSLIHRLDAVALEAMCPRSIAARRLLTRALDSEAR